ncbi:MAG: hypothetical protein ACKVX7_12280 [Planctomycetota bacterium]
MGVQHSGGAAMSVREPSASEAVLKELSVKEIMRRHPRDFLLLDRCKFDERGRVKLARVLKSSRECSTLYRCLNEFPNSVIIYAGADHQDQDGAFLDSGQSYEAFVRAV